MNEKIFISYRRKDSPSSARLLYNHLLKSYKKENIFFDIDIIKPGENFPKKVEMALNKCDFFIAILGPRWKTLQDYKFVNNEEDHTYYEVKRALELGVEIIPVLVEFATMPSRAELLDGIKDLSVITAVQLRDISYNSDLIILDQILQKGQRNFIIETGEEVKLKNYANINGSNKNWVYKILVITINLIVLFLFLKSCFMDIVNKGGKEELLGSPNGATVSDSIRQEVINDTIIPLYDTITEQIWEEGRIFKKVLVAGESGYLNEEVTFSGDFSTSHLSVYKYCLINVFFPNKNFTDISIRPGEAIEFWDEIVDYKFLIKLDKAVKDKEMNEFSNFTITPFKRLKTQKVIPHQPS